MPKKVPLSTTLQLNTLTPLTPVSTCSHSLVGSTFSLTLVLAQLFRCQEPSSCECSVSVESYLSQLFPKFSLKAHNGGALRCRTMSSIHGVARNSWCGLALCYIFHGCLRLVSAMRLSGPHKSLYSHLQFFCSWPHAICAGACWCLSVRAAIIKREQVFSPYGHIHVNICAL